jgi:hypothetical protein
MKVDTVSDLDRSHCGEMHRVERELPLACAFHLWWLRLEPLHGSSNHVNTSHHISLHVTARDSVFIPLSNHVCTLQGALTLACMGPHVPDKVASSLGDVPATYWDSPFGHEISECAVRHG